MLRNLLTITELGYEPGQLMPEAIPHEGKNVLYGIFAGVEGGQRRRANICKGSATLEACDLPPRLHIKITRGAL